MNSTDGSSNVTRLTDTDAYYSNPDWGTGGSSQGGDDGGGPPTTRPNGKIAFVKGPFEEHEFDDIYTMNAADGSKQTRLTNNNATDTDPSWSPMVQR